MASCLEVIFFLYLATEQVLRRDYLSSHELDHGDEVKALRLNTDGSLQVLHKKSGLERTLTAEYLR